MNTVRWDRCYDSSWRGLIVPEAFAHPAKMARGLVVRIFDHLFDLGALHRGDCVVDPFGGIGSTAIEGASRGLHVVCCELEPKFVALARENIEMHRHMFEDMGLPVPTMVQGDSRRLRELVAPVLDAVVSSPPYVGRKAHPSLGHPEFDPSGGDIADRATRPVDPRYGDAPGQLSDLPEGTVEAVVASPPYAEIAAGAGGLNTEPPKHAGQQSGRSITSASQDTDSRYGWSEGQLARLPKGAVDAVVSSPPYPQPYAGGGGINARGYTPGGVKVNYGLPPDKVGERTYQGTAGDRAEGNLETLTLGAVDAVVTSPPYVSGGHHRDVMGAWNRNGGGYDDDAISHEQFKPDNAGYGTTDGQMGQMAEGAVDAVVTSPPYEASVDSVRSGIDWRKVDPKRDGGPPASANSQGVTPFQYGDTDGQLGREEGETFWQAADVIVRECYALLKPGGVAVWVVKAFVRNKHVVDFPGDWRRLCEHAGFETLEEIHASLVHEETHAGLFGDTTTRRERKSFFRRLAEAKGSPRIDWETVWVMRKAPR